MAHVIDHDPNVLLHRFARLPAAAPLLERLRAVPEDVFVVGGAVRDLMLATVPLELDLVVESELDATLARLGAAGRRYGRFATATLQLCGFRYDLARARREMYPQPGALPVVAPASIDEDLGRRDFTVNAIALCVAGPRRGLTIAVDHAFEDLRTGCLRVLHDSSFVDDPTRLLRLALYSSRLHFAIEHHTLALAARAVRERALRTVSGTRTGAELQRLAAEPDPVGALLKLRELGIDTALAPGFGLSDPEPVRRALALLPEDGDPATLALAAAGAGLQRAELARLLGGMAFAATQREAIVAAAGGAPPLATALDDATRPSEIADAVGKAGIETVALAGGYGAAEAARRWLTDLRFVQLAIDGRDLLAAGVASGPAVGAGLRAALAAKLDGCVQDRGAELAVALEAAFGGGR
jgi:tRNA nucleotidyltransferase (CCA-adding enzyme)